MNNENSDKDKEDWENFISNEEDLFDKDEISQKHKAQRVRNFDFHGYSLDDANEKIKDLIYESYNQGVGKLIIVTGKGLHSENEKNPYISKNLGILKYSLPEFIKNDPELMSLIYDIKDAQKEDGGSGAFYIFLKKKFIK